jgi:hypothetical protein
MLTARGSRLTICIDCDTSEVFAMKVLVLLALMTTPALAGSVAVTRLDGSAGFVIALVFSMVLLREAILICMILMRRWQLFGRDLFLIEQDGRHRWVDALELKSMPETCRVRAREFRPDFLHLRRRPRD